MSDNRKMSGSQSSSDDENKTQEVLNLSNKKEEESQTSSKSSDAVAAFAVPVVTRGINASSAVSRAVPAAPYAVPPAMGYLAASHPILFRLLRDSLADRNLLLVQLLNNIPDEDWIGVLRNWDSEYPRLEEQDMKSSLKRKLKSASETGVDKPDASHSDEDAPPAKKPLLDTPDRETISPSEPHNLPSEPLQAAADASVAPTTTLPTQSGDRDPTQRGTDSSGQKNGKEELNGVKTPNFPRPPEVRNILPLFVLLFRRLFDLETFLVERHVPSDGSPIDEATAGPSSRPTVPNPQLATTSDEFGAGLALFAASPTLEMEPLPGKKAESGAAAIQENTVGNSLGETADPTKKSKNIPILRLLHEEVQNCLSQCIGTTESVLSTCLEHGTNRLLEEVESCIAGILDTLHILVEVQKACNGLRQKCRNLNDKAGVSYILKVSTAVSQAHNRLLNNILTLNDLFREDVANSPQSDSDN